MNVAALSHPRARAELFLSRVFSGVTGMNALAGKQFERGIVGRDLSKRLDR